MRSSMESSGEYSVRLTDYSAAQAKAILDTQLPNMLPVKLCAFAGGVEQHYSLNGQVDFQTAFSDGNEVQFLIRMKKLCQDAIEYPELMDEDIGVFAADRLFWQPDEMRWRCLLLIAKSEAWESLPVCTPDEIWSSLFTAAMEASELCGCVLQNIVDAMQDVDFELPELLRVIDEEITSRVHGLKGSGDMKTAPEKAREKPEEVPPPVTAPVVSVETIGPTEDPEEEYRPWENGNVAVGSATFPTTASTEDRKIPVDRPLGHYMPPEQPPRENPSQPMIPGVAPPKPQRSEDYKLVQPVIPGMAPPPQPPVGTRRPSAFDGDGTGTTVLHIPETGLLEEPAAAKPEKQPCLVRVRTQEKVPLNRPYFVIGSRAENVDFFVRDNRVVSRRHAAIVTKGPEFFLVDLGSRNGVYINGRRIPSNQETRIRTGEVFVLANEEMKLER